jgi:catechol 2,3-dioxygenase
MMGHPVAGPGRVLASEWCVAEWRRHRAGVEQRRFGCAKVVRVPVSVSKVGHVVLRVRQLDDALRFYCGALGLHEVARRDFGEGPMAFLSTGSSHHDIALVEVGAGAAQPTSPTVGLHHVALKIGDTLDELADAKAHLEGLGVAVHVVLDHHVSQGLYVSDPDGNLLELYVDADPDVWRNDPSQVANSDPLAL